MRVQRFMVRVMVQFMVVGLVLGLAAVLSGCASSGGGTSESTSESGSAQAAEPMKKVDVPKGSPLAKVEIGMNDSQVRSALGEPANVRGYPTGKNWIPFYFGGDTYRFDWTYTNVGKVIFANTSRWSRAVEVVDVIHDPNQK